MAKRSPRLKFANFDDIVVALQRGDQASLVNALANCPELRDISFAYSPAFGTGTFCTASNLADALIRSSATDGARKAVADLQLAMLSKRVPAIQVIAIYGLNVAETHDFAEFAIMPFAHLPTQYGPQHFGGTSFAGTAIVRKVSTEI